MIAPTMEQLGMKRMRRKNGRQRLLSSPIASTCVIVSALCLLFVVVSIVRMPHNDSAAHWSETQHHHRDLKNDGDGLGPFGEMMINMLPDDLSFTVFVPLETAFKRDLGLQMNDSSSTAEKRDNTYAIVSRVLGFSAVPRKLYSNSVPVKEEVSFDSVSGFRLNVYRGLDGSLLVNRVRSVSMDMLKGDIVVHMMDGVVMDAEFEQSF
ncbi:hypothetical protein Dimus_007173 [Dionaea muscipula]